MNKNVFFKFVFNSTLYHFPTETLRGWGYTEEGEGGGGRGGWGWTAEKEGRGSILKAIALPPAIPLIV